MRSMDVVVIQVTEVVLFRKLGGNEVRLRHFSLRQVKSSVIIEYFLLSRATREQFFR
jgi:hypothetical protein